MNNDKHFYLNTNVSTWTFFPSAGLVVVGIRTNEIDRMRDEFYRVLDELNILDKYERCYDYSRAENNFSIDLDIEDMRLIYKYVKNMSK